MRAKVAKRANGHVFEDRFMKLDGLRLMIAYRQAEKDEKEQFDLIKDVIQGSFKRFDDYFETLRLFTNPKLWYDLQEEMKLKDLRDEVKVEDFDKEWERLMQVIPQVVTVETPKSDSKSKLPALNAEHQEVITGFLSKRKPMKEGGNE